MTIEQLKKYIGQIVEIVFTDNSHIAGELGYTPEYSAKYGYRKSNYFTVNNCDFKVSHIKALYINRKRIDSVSEAQLRAQAKYDKDNTVQIKLKLNKRTDKDIIERLSEADSKQGYIKELIRLDILRDNSVD